MPARMILMPSNCNILEQAKARSSAIGFFIMSCCSKAQERPPRIWIPKGEVENRTTLWAENERAYHCAYFPEIALQCIHAGLEIASIIPRLYCAHLPRSSGGSPFQLARSSFASSRQGDVLYSEGQSHIDENIGQTSTHVVMVEMKPDAKGAAAVN